jgi:hypothetical protein
VLDLGQARLEGPEVELEIYNLFGTVTVIAPPGIAVDVSGGGAFASQVLEPPAWPAPDGAPRADPRAGTGRDAVRALVSRRGAGRRAQPAATLNAREVPIARPWASSAWTWKDR